MFDDMLFQYGISGVFIAYLIFDRQILLKGLKESLNQNTQILRKIEKKI